MEYKKQKKLALRIFKGKKYKELRKAIQNKKCFSELIPIAEEAGAIEYWDEFVDEWKHYAGLWWSGVTDDMKIKAFKKMKDDEWKYYAGKTWEGITNEMRIEAFPKLSDERKYWAGRSWKGITDEMRRVEFPKFNDEWKHYAEEYWKGIQD